MTNQQIINDLEDVRKAVFGDVGDEPDIYADYDLCTELSGKMRRAIAAIAAQEQVPVDVATTEQRHAEQRRRESEHAAFHKWFKERGYPDYPERYPLITENAMHAAWQEAAKRSALVASTPSAPDANTRTVAPVEVYQIIKDVVIDKENVSAWSRRIAAALSSQDTPPAPVSSETVEPRAWFVKDFADGWIYFDNAADARREVEATGSLMMLGYPSYAAQPLPVQDAAREAFKAGWRTNATWQQPEDYLEGCEQVDFEEYQSLGLTGYLESIKPPQDDALVASAQHKRIMSAAAAKMAEGDFMQKAVESMVSGLPMLVENTEKGMEITHVQASDFWIDPAVAYTLNPSFAQPTYMTLGNIRIDLKTGDIQINGAMDLDEAAKMFWEAVTHAVPK